MKNIESVNKIKHAKTRITARKAKELGDGIMYAHTFPNEFRFLQTQYPILFHKNVNLETYEAVALFGFQEGENLFLNQDSGWEANYIPLMVQRQPFHIGFRPGLSQTDPELRVMHINMDSPRVNEEEGERLFTDNGENSDFLNYIAAMLETIHHWEQQAQDFYRELHKYDLLESVNFDITLPSGMQSQLIGFYTVNEDKLQSLDGAALENLNKKGFLLPIYMAIASIDNIKKLIALKNKQEKR
jgi:hypothetical protein